MGALRTVVLALAFLAFVGINLVDELSHADRRVRAFELAGAASRAQIWVDHISHD